MNAGGGLLGRDKKFWFYSEYDEVPSEVSNGREVTDL